MPFYSPESRRLAAFFAVVYFAQGMWSLPNQALKMALKDRRVSASGLEARALAAVREPDGASPRLT